MPARGLYVVLGPEVGFLLQAHGDFKSSFLAPPPTSSPGVAATRPNGNIFEQVGTFDGYDGDVTGHYHRLNLAIGGGIGYAARLLGHEGTFEVRYSHGLLDMARSDAVTRQTRGIEAVLGLRW